jgi:hypothetical protein
VDISVVPQSLDDEEDIVDRAFDSMALQSIRFSIIGSKHFNHSLLFIRAVDNTIKQFIDLFSSKVTISI